MSDVTKWSNSPFRMFSDFQKHFDDVWGVPSKDINLARTSFTPRVEFNETAENYHVRFEIPGMDKENIDVEFHDNTLTVSGKKETEQSSEDKGITYSEFSYGSFTRSFKLPQSCDAEKVQASFDNGVLEVVLEKKEANNPRKITVK